MLKLVYGKIKNKQTKTVIKSTIITTITTKNKTSREKEKTNRKELRSKTHT